MSKNKLLYYIGSKVFEDVQRLSIYVYVEAMKNKDYNFEEYFELNYVDIINDSLHFLEIKSPENYKSIYYEILNNIYVMSKTNAVYHVKHGLSNRRAIFDYWTKNNKNILQKIVNAYTNEQKMK